LRNTRGGKCQEKKESSQPKGTDNRREEMINQLKIRLKEAEKETQIEKKARLLAEEKS
jgi:hypothetical protein